MANAFTVEETFFEIILTYCNKKLENILKTIFNIAMKYMKGFENVCNTVCGSKNEPSFFYCSFFLPLSVVATKILKMIILRCQSIEYIDHRPGTILYRNDRYDVSI